MLGSLAKFIGSVPAVNNDDSLWGLNAAKFALDDLKRHGIDISSIHHYDCMDFPTSSVVVNQQNGSRTIMHYRGELPELSIDTFQKLDFGNYSWFHFEGRPNIDIIISAMKLITEYNDDKSEAEKIKISVELEKFHVKNLFKIAEQADMVFVSTDYAKNLGYKTATECVEGLKEKLTNRTEIVCTWGSSGAACGDSGNTAVMIPAVSPEKVVDTTGAGDSFIAGVIHARRKGKLLKQSVEFGCRVAEWKITDYGFDHVKEFVSSI